MQKNTSMVKPERESQCVRFQPCPTTAPIATALHFTWNLLRKSSLPRYPELISWFRRSASWYHLFGKKRGNSATQPVVDCLLGVRFPVSRAGNVDPEGQGRAPQRRLVGRALWTCLFWSISRKIMFTNGIGHEWWVSVLSENQSKDSGPNLAKTRHRAPARQVIAFRKRQDRVLHCCGRNRRQTAKGQEIATRKNLGVEEKNFFWLLDASGGFFLPSSWLLLWKIAFKAPSLVAFNSHFPALEAFSERSDVSPIHFGLKSGFGRIQLETSGEWKVDPSGFSPLTRHAWRMGAAHPWPQINAVGTPKNAQQTPHHKRSARRPIFWANSAVPSLESFLRAPECSRAASACPGQLLHPWLPYLGPLRYPWHVTHRPTKFQSLSRQAAPIHEAVNVHLIVLVGHDLEQMLHVVDADTNAGHVSHDPGILHAVHELVLGSRLACDLHCWNIRSSVEWCWYC